MVDRDPQAPVPASAARPGTLDVFRSLALHENSWFFLGNGYAGQQENEKDKLFHFYAPA